MASSRVGARIKQRTCPPPSPHHVEGGDSESRRFSGPGARFPDDAFSSEKFWNRGCLDRGWRFKAGGGNGVQKGFVQF